MESSCKEDLDQADRQMPETISGLRGMINPINLRKLLFVISFILMVEGVLFLLCIPWSVYFNEPSQPFIWSSIISFLSGIGMFLFSTKKFESVSNTKEGFALISISWMILILTGTLPYLFSHTMSKFVDVLFETTSGITTTGSSVITQLGRCSTSILFWRSLSHWSGGFFTLLMVGLIFPSIHINENSPFESAIKTNNHLFSNQDLLFKQITLIYGITTVVLCMLLLLEGMNVLDSFCYAFATVSTGSFISNPANTEAYSGLIQVTLMFFMLLAGIGYYSLLIVTLKRKRLTKSFRSELKYFLVITGFAVVVVCVGLYEHTGKVGDSIRVGTFQVLSFVSGTGLTVTRYFGWSNFLLAFLFLLPIMGSCSTSLSGGIKFHRLRVIGLQMRHSFGQFYSEGETNNVNKSKKEGGSFMSAMSLTILLIFITILGTIILSVVGVSSHHAIFFAVSSITNLGHNIDLTDYGSVEKIVMIIMMLAGRLEIYPLLVLLLPSFYYKKTTGGIK